MKVALCMDVETTGTDVEKDRVVELAFIAQDLDTGREIMRYAKRVNPERGIPAKATAVHGLTEADVMGCPTFRQIAPALVPLLDKTALIVGHNFQGFDAPLILHEFIRAGITLKGFPPIVDTMLEGRWATPDGKMPTLGELCWSCGIDYDPAQAHSALYDVDINLQAWREGMRLGAFTMPSVPCKEALAT